MMVFFSGSALCFWSLILGLDGSSQVLIGGGKNHRMGLFDMAMIKDNHISVAGGVTEAIRSIDQFLRQNELQMEVEVRLFRLMRLV